MGLRPYQVEAVDKVDEEWAKGNKRTLLVLPTGTGKTICFSETTRRQVNKGKRVLILAHRMELLDQAAEKLKKSTGIDSALDKAESHAADTKAQVVVGSVQTLSRESRLNEYPVDAFSTIIVDEAHHCLSDSYQKILNYFDANVLGVTATPDRGDMKSLGEFFDSLAFEYTLPRAIREGYLSKIKAQTIPLNIDISKVGMQNGDYAARDLGCALDQYLEEIAKIISAKYGNRKIVAFLPLVDTSKHFRDLLIDEGVPAWEVNGNSPDRVEILETFEHVKSGVLCNSMLLTEGWDCPSVDCVIVLRPTKIRSLYCQMIGRGTRLCEGKDHLLILDFLWHTSRHDLCRPTNLICKKDEIAKVIEQKMDEEGLVIDINDETIEKATESVKADREEKLRKEIEAQKRKKSKLIDIMQLATSIDIEDLDEYEPTFRWEEEEPTEKQISALERFGVNTSEIKYKGYASNLLNKLFTRKNAGFSSPKQINLLERYGFHDVARWSSDSASGMIGIISANRWMVPYHINPETYVPADYME